MRLKLCKNIFRSSFSRNSIEERNKFLLISTITAFRYMFMKNGAEEIVYTKMDSQLKIKGNLILHSD